MAEGLELFKNSSKKILSVAGEGGARPIFDDLHAEELSQPGVAFERATS